MAVSASLAIFCVIFLSPSVEKVFIQCSVLPHDELLFVGVDLVYR